MDHRRTTRLRASLGLPTIIRVRSGSKQGVRNETGSKDRAARCARAAGNGRGGHGAGRLGGGLWRRLEGAEGAGVTVKHKLGETTVEGTPERVVTIGNQWLDASLALGVTPVGYADNVSILAGGQKVPWAPDSSAMPKC